MVRLLRRNAIHFGEGGINMSNYLGQSLSGQLRNGFSERIYLSDTSNRKKDIPTRMGNSNDARGNDALCLRKESASSKNN